MRLIKVGRWRLNLAALISVEEIRDKPDRADLRPGDVVVAMRPGDKFALSGEEARELCRAFDSEIQWPAADPVVGHSVDPSGGYPA